MFEPFWSCLIVFEGVGMGRFWLEYPLGGFATGRLLAWSSLGPIGWQWLEEATALPRVGLLDGPECRGHAEQPRWDTAPDKHHPHCRSRPSPTCFWQVEKHRGMPEPTLGDHGAIPNRSKGFPRTRITKSSCACDCAAHSSFCLIFGKSRNIGHAEPTLGSMEFLPPHSTCLTSVHNSLKH